MDYQYDIAVIGAGPGGYETAIKAAQMGKKTCIIESTYLGGTCLNVGCIPTKTLIKTANVLDTVKHAADFAVEGVDLSALKVDMAKLQKRRQKVVSTLVGGVRGLLRGNKVDILEGTASFADTHTLTVGDKQVSAEYIIVATGSSVFMPPFIAVEGENRLLTSTEALGLDEVPDSVAVIGGGGRTPNTEGLNAQGIGLEFDRNAIKTDLCLRTNVPNIYAIGDVNGKAMLAHTASHEGMVAVANICGRHEEMHYDRIPSCIYLEPEIACIGLTEPQARENYGDNLKIGRFSMMANGKSLVEGDTDGLFKVIVAGDTGEILGVHLYGQHVTDMIGEVSAAMTAEATAEELIGSIHPHPTVNEALGEAFMAAWNGKAINSL